MKPPSNDNIRTTKQSKTKPCAQIVGYTDLEKNVSVQTLFKQHLISNEHFYYKAKRVDENIKCYSSIAQKAFIYRLVKSVYMMTSSNGNIFRVTGPLCGEFTGHRWIPLTKASDAKLWCFLWSAPE